MLTSFLLPFPRHGIAAWLLLAAATAAAQTAPDTYLVGFTDKTNTPYALDRPEEFLSPRAIARRRTQHIAIDELDLPVDPVYIATVLAQGQVALVNRSKWTNAISIRTTDQAALQAITALPFVRNVRGTSGIRRQGPLTDKFAAVDTSPEGGRDDYGDAYMQTVTLNGHRLHDLGARGEGMLIGVLDAGFRGMDTLSAFQGLRGRGGIVLARDLVDHDDDVYADHWHGTSVLGCMAASIPGRYLGTATQADYVLLRTEDAATEFIVEEDHWTAGAELADSLGCDVINTSLGYTTFDDSTQDHTYADLDGMTTRISIAAGIAARKGMVPVISAGNSGASAWYHISAPADAIGVLAVGAVDLDSVPAAFSGHGPSADGRVKPDVAAMGRGTVSLGPDGALAGMNGTSFAAPLVSGLVACLWQLHPQRTAEEVMDAVRQSASRYANPDDRVGYGIPDFLRAHHLLEATSLPDHRSSDGLLVFPVPFTDHLEIVLPATWSGEAEVSLHDLAGRVLWARRTAVDGGRLVLGDDRLAALGAGLYVLRVRAGSLSLARSVVKAR